MPIPIKTLSHLSEMYLVKDHLIGMLDAVESGHEREKRNNRKRQLVVPVFRDDVVCCLFGRFNSIRHRAIERRAISLWLFLQRVFGAALAQGGRRRTHGGDVAAAEEGR